MCTDPEPVRLYRGRRIPSPRKAGEKRAAHNSLVRNDLVPWWLRDGSSDPPGSPHADTALVNGSPLIRQTTSPTSPSDGLDTKDSSESSPPEKAPSPAPSPSPRRAAKAQAEVDDDPGDMSELTDEVLAEQKKHVCR